MEIDFLPYKIRNGDTLTSVASRLGMSSEELKEFHNSHCPKMDRLWFENLNGVNTLFVPIHYKTESQKEQERRSSLPSSLSPSFFAKTYTVSETSESPSEPSLTTDYRLHLKIRKDQKKNIHVVSFHQDHFKTSGETPDNKINELSIGCMISIMPLEFIINEEGKITGFENHKKLVGAFGEQRKELEGFFIGEESAKYINTFEKNIANQQVFLQQFQSTLLFQTLFPRIDWFHRTRGWKESFYFLQNTFSIPCHIEIHQENKHQDEVVTTFTGNSLEFYSLSKIKSANKYHQSAEDGVSGEFMMEYTTHKKNKNLIQASARISLWHEETSVQQHTITITQG